MKLFKNKTTESNEERLKENIELLNIRIESLLAHIHYLTDELLKLNPPLQRKDNTTHM